MVAVAMRGFLYLLVFLLLFHPGEGCSQPSGSVAADAESEVNTTRHTISVRGGHLTYTARAGHYLPPEHRAAVAKFIRGTLAMSSDRVSQAIGR